MLDLSIATAASIALMQNPQTKDYLYPENNALNSKYMANGCENFLFSNILIKIEINNNKN